MADWYDRIDDDRRAFIERQHMFFVATAPDDLSTEWPNLSPKGRTLVKVLGPNLVGWLDYPGSGNQTATHTAQNGKVTVMFCSFDATAGILRVFGRGRAVDLDDPLLAEHRQAFLDDAHPYVRQAFFVDVEKVQTSCGYAVPRYEFVKDRDTLDRYCENKLEPLAMRDGMPVAGPLLAKVRA
ncbi:MAG: pyridoxamine 5'-phosphate oxidase family protein [Dehalococcoidia bacterium]